MDEAKKLLRYIFPGGIFILELGVMLFISHLSVLEKTGSALNISLTGGAAGAAFVLILGFFFSNIYHACTDEPTTDNQNWIDDTVNWTILTLELGGEQYKRLNRRTETLTDHLHSNGATFYASIGTLITWIILTLLLPLSSRLAGAIALVFQAFLIYIHLESFTRTKEKFHKTKDGLLKHLKSEKRKRTSDLFDRRVKITSTSDADKRKRTNTGRRLYDNPVSTGSRN